MRQAMAKRFPDHSDLDEVLQIAQGRPSLALRLLSEPQVFADFKGLYHQIDTFLKGNDLLAKFSYVEALEKEEEKLNLFFDSFSFVLRKIAHDYVSNKAHPLMSRFELREINSLFEQLLKTRYLIDRNANKKLALENFFLLTEK